MVGLTVAHPNFSFFFCVFEYLPGRRCQCSAHRIQFLCGLADVAAAPRHLGGVFPSLTRLPAAVAARARERGRWSVGVPLFLEVRPGGCFHQKCMDN